MKKLASPIVWTLPQLYMAKAEAGVGKPYEVDVVITCETSQEASALADEINKSGRILVSGISERCNVVLARGILRPPELPNTPEKIQCILKYGHEGDCNFGSDGNIVAQHIRDNGEHHD